MAGIIEVKDQGVLRIYDADNSNYVDIVVPSTVSSNRTITIPDATFTIPTADTVFSASTITGQSAETSVADDDLVVISDTSASGALKKMTKANFVGSTGKILQVVSDTGATYNQSNTTTTYADVQKSGSTWEVAITPSATSSKIFGVVTIQFSFAGSDAQARTALDVQGKIGSGSYSSLTSNGFTGLYDASDQPDFHSSDTFNFLWSPSTTSECKVKLQFKNAYTSSNMTSSINSTGTNQTVITLMEVAG